jgi:murein DD-endopeptidase
MPRVSLREAFGLDPLGRAVKHAVRAFKGAPYEPPVQFGLSSLKIFHPEIGFPAWLGIERPDRRVRVYKLFNHNPQGRDEGYSVRVTHAVDFRGKQFTYDGHLGTDFACPVGTPLTTAAEGIVHCVTFDFDRGATKIAIDHGGGLLTTYAHCARSLVEPGQYVARGQTIALSGAAGMDILLCFPWVAPHVHFNAWVGGVPHDPYARDGEVSLWLHHNNPLPVPPGEREAAPSPSTFEPSRFDEHAIEIAIDACRDPDWRAHFRSIDSLHQRAGELIVQMNYRSAMFERHVDIYAEPSTRRPALDLPYRAEDYAGAWLPD